MSRHNVESVIGPDPGNGNMFFWGAPGPSQLDENGQPVQDSFQIPQGSIDAFGQQRAEAANAALAAFLTDGDARLERMRQEKATAVEQVRAFVDTEKARAIAGIATSKQAALGAFANARQTVAQNAATAKAAVQASLGQIHVQIDAKLASALGSVTAKNQASTGQVTTLRTTFTQEVQSAFTSGVSGVQNVGADYAGRALEGARARAAYYRGLPLPQHGAVSNFFNGGDFEANKKAARVDAATQVGAAYAEEFRAKAGEVARGLQNGAQQVTSGAGQTFTNANSSLGTALTEARNGLNNAARQAKQSAQDFVTAKLGAIDSQTAQFNGVLTRAQQEATQQYTTMETQTAQSIESTGNTVISMLESGYGSAIKGMSQVIDEVRGVADGAEPPDPDKLKEILAY